MRGLGVQSWLSGLPDAVVVLFSLVTQLGDVWLLTLLVLSTYWFGPRLPRVGDAVDRERAAVAAGILLAGFAVVAVGKPMFELPRPPGAGQASPTALVPEVLWPLYEYLSTGTGHGFPSGHAVGSTTAFGGLAWAIRTDRHRRRVAVAAGLIAVVSLSRLVLGLHYLVDVLAGIGFGVVVLGVAIRLRSPARVFGFAALIAAMGLAVVGPLSDIVLVAGVTTGAWLGWIAVGDEMARPPTREGAAATATAGIVSGGPLLIAVEVVPTTAVTAGAVAFVGGLAVVAMPLIGERVAKRIGSKTA